METLNTIEKITLLISTGIVCLANLFVLLERAKRSEKQNSNSAIQKLMTIKNTFFVFVLIVVMSSCSGSKFLNRKYTSGRFTEHKRSLTHNTIYIDTTQNYASVNNEIELKKSPANFCNNSKKEIVDAKVASIIKKDSIFIKVKRGKDQKIVKANDLNYDVTMRIDKKGTIISQKTEPVKNIDPETKNNESYKKLKLLSKVALIFCAVPFLGLGIALKFKKKLTAYKKDHSTEDLKKCSSKARIALLISGIISSYVAALILGFLFFLILALLLTA